MNGKLQLRELEELVASGAVDTVLSVFPDMQGRLLGKRVTGRYFVEHGSREMHACDYLLATDMEMETVPGYRSASWNLGYGDFVVRPDLDTLRRVPWLPNTALVIGDVVDHEGALLPHAPRSVLRRQLERLEAMGFGAKMASELELYVFDETYEDARRKGYRDLNTAGAYIQDYHILQTTREEPLMRAIRNALDEAGVAVECSKGEWGPGQEELNLEYCEALEMADRHSILKHAAKEIALSQGKAVTFMAKWRGDLAGSSCHIHTSLWKGDAAAFYDAGEERGMSCVFRQFLAGLLANARAMTLLLAPHVNSYKRFQAASFAPTKVVWSGDNRTAGFRLIGHGPSLRVECRIPGADANPYLAYAAILAAGMHGIEQKLELPPPWEGNAYDGSDVPEVPKTLRDAIGELDRSEVLRAALGDAVVEHYLHAARWEQAELDRRVTDWEIARNFERA